MSEFTGGVNPYFETVGVITVPKRLPREQVLNHLPPVGPRFVAIAVVEEQKSAEARFLRIATSAP